MFSDISEDTCETLPMSISEGTCEAHEKNIIKRQTISIVDKERLINAYENGDDAYELGRLMGIKYGTVKNIIGRYNKYAVVSKGSRGGHKKSIITEDIGNSLLDFIDKNYCATLQEMKQYLQSHHSIDPCTSTISLFLKHRYITKKKLRHSVIAKNCDRVKLTRKEYVDAHLRNGVRLHQCIYIDETAINVWMSRTSGRSKRGERVYHQICAQRGPNISLVLAISIKGPIHFKAIIGSFKRESYQDFITNVSQRLPATLHYLIHDNASIHNNTLSTTELHNIVKLPPYSPFLNPIETVFSQLKSKLRAQLTTTTKPKDKCQLVESLVTQILATSDFNDLSAHYEHIHRFFPDSLYEKDNL